jgi:uncharacterized protein (TIGR02266 family)
MTKNNPEKRAHPRVPMMVKVVDQKTGKVRDYFSREISCGGIFIESQNPYEAGNKVTLEFQVPGTESRLKVSAEVVHVTSEGEKGGFSGFGLRFLDLDGYSEKTIADYVEKLENIRKKLAQ